MSTDPSALGRGEKRGGFELGGIDDRLSSVENSFSIRAMRFVLFLLLCLCAPAVAFADPCEGPLPRTAGAEFSGVVRYVGDGDSLCVGAAGAPPSTWIEVRLADFNAPELSAADGPAARALLRRIALGRQATCIATRGRSGRVVSYDRVIAVCSMDQRRLGDLLRQAGGAEGGN